jgi:hypothetical protein
LLKTKNQRLLVVPARTAFGRNDEEGLNAVFFNVASAVLMKQAACMTQE